MFIYLHLISYFLNPKYSFNSYSNYSYINRDDGVERLTYCIKITKSKRKGGARIWYFTEDFLRP